MAIVTVSVHGQILDPDTSLPAVGTVTFKNLTELRDTVDNITYEPGVWTATLDILGEFTVVLPATDSPDLTPTGWLYQVYISTSHWRDTFYISLPTTLAPSVEFADLTPIQPDDGSGCTPDGTACAPISLVAEVAALQTQVDALQVEVDDLETQITGFQDQIDALDLRLDDVEADVATIAGQILTIQGQITTLQGQITTIQGQITSLNTTVGALVGQVNVLTPQVATNTTDIATLQGQVTTIQGQITTIQGQIATIQGQITALQTAQTATQTELDLLETQVVYLNPVAGIVYVGNQFIGPQATGGVPWLSNSSNPIPYSPGDTNFDIIRIIAIDEFGNQVTVMAQNGNGEGRDRPSSRSRVARRTFESAEAVGFSTGQFWQASSNPTAAASREAYLGTFGSAHATKPGWAEATRVLSGLGGVSVGGTVNAALAPYNGLTAFIYRGLKTTAGPPAAGTWLVNDVVLDSLGVVYRCTVAGTPGTWVGNVNGTPVVVGFTAPAGNAALISDGTGTGAPYALTTTLKTADNRVYFDGAVANNGGAIITGGTVLFTVTAAHAPTAWVQCNERTSTTLSARVTVRPDGTCRLDQPLAIGATLSLDGFNYRKS